MAHYSFLNQDNIVVAMIPGKDEEYPEDTYWEEYYGEIKGMTCKRTSYWTRGGIHYDPETNEPSADQSKAFRMNTGVPGSRYDPERDAFIKPSPYPSWLLDEETLTWYAPIPRPENGFWIWSEDLGNWVKFDDDTQSWIINN